MGLAERIADLTAQLVAIPTHETEGPAQELLASWLTTAGFECRLDELEPGRTNLIAHRDGAGGTFLCSHVDVHPPHDHPDPFVCRQQDGRLIGRGVLDAKGQIAAAVAAVEVVRDSRALLAITCDEERGGLGSEQLSVPDGPWFTDGGIVLEPTDFSICTAQMGNVDVRVDVTGIPSHAYTPQPPGSPIAAVLAAADALETCSFLKARHPLLPPPRLHIGRITGGEHTWRTPGRGSIELTLGVVPGSDIAEAEAEVKERLEDTARRWRDRVISYEYEVVDRSEAVEVPVDRVPVAERIARSMEVAFEAAGMPSWTDAGNLLVKHGLPCVVFGAGQLTPAHSDLESVTVADLVRLAEILSGVLARTGEEPR